MKHGKVDLAKFFDALVRTVEEHASRTHDFLPRGELVHRLACSSDPELEVAFAGVVSQDEDPVAYYTRVGKAVDWFSAHITSNSAIVQPYVRRVQRPKVAGTWAYRRADLAGVDVKYSVPATRKAWKLRKHGTEVAPIPFELRLGPESLGALLHGFRPAEMEDHWIAFHECQTLYFHRSWTGFAIFRVEVQESADRVLLHDAKLFINPSQHGLAEQAPDQIVAHLRAVVKMVLERPPESQGWPQEIDQDVPKKVQHRARSGPGIVDEARRSSADGSRASSVACATTRLAQGSAILRPAPTPPPDPRRRSL